MFKVIDTYFDGLVKVISVPVFSDERGFLELPFIAEDFNALGIPAYFPRDMHARSSKNVIRGLHFQSGMGKLVRVTRGKAFIAVVDLGSFRSISRIESEKTRNQIWIPSGFAFGYCALSTVTEIQYKCTRPFNADLDSAVRWNDPDIGIPWPTKHPILSDRDRQAPTVEDFR